MKLDTFNFLQEIKNLITGGGRTASGIIKNDAGFAHDVNMSLNDIIGVVTDSSGGTAGATVAANSYKQTFIIPIQLKGLVNAAVWKVAIPFAATVTAALFRTGVVVSTAAKAATLTVTTNGGGAVTGGVMALTSANQNATGGTVAATAISGAGATITAGQTIEVTVSGVTAFVEGDGYVEFTVTNNDLANAAATTLAQLNMVSSETNLRVFSAPASTTTVGYLTLVIPRDYDENTDSFSLKITTAMAGSTDTPTLSASVYRKRPGSSIATVATSVAGKNVGQTATVTLSSASQVVEFNFSQNTLKRDDAITIVLTSTAHTTDALLLYSVEPVYRSTLVSYNESDNTNGYPDLNNPLR